MYHKASLSPVLSEKEFRCTIEFVAQNTSGLHYLGCNNKTASANAIILNDERQNLESCWRQMIYNFTFFTLTFDSAHLIFAVKYWNLSLRLEQMLKKEVPSRWQKLKVPFVFWSTLFLLSFSCICMVSLGNLELTKYHFGIDKALNQTVTYN